MIDFSPTIHFILWDRIRHSDWLRYQWSLLWCMISIIYVKQLISFSRPCDLQPIEVTLTKPTYTKAPQSVRTRCPPCAYRMDKHVCNAVVELFVPSNLTVTVTGSLKVGRWMYLFKKGRCVARYWWKVDWISNNRVRRDSFSPLLCAPMKSCCIPIVYLSSICLCVGWKKNKKLGEIGEKSEQAEIQTSSDVGG